MKLNGKSFQVLIGSILGDGYLTKNGTNCYFQETHSLKQKEYLKWKQNYIKPSKITNRVINNYKIGKQYKSIRLTTPNDEFFTEMQSIFYKNNKKIVPKEILNQINDLGLTVWFLDDGHVAPYSDLINISTDGFSFNENDLIKSTLENKWKAKVRVAKRKNRPYIKFDKPSSIKLLHIFSKTFDKHNLPDSMRYKLGSLWEGNKEKWEEDHQKRNKWKKEMRKKKSIKRLKDKKNIEEKKINKIKELYYNQEKSMSQIAAMLDYKSHVTILNLMKKYNLKRRTTSQACNGEKNGFFGKKHTKQTKNTISKAMKRVVE
jgi:hypothetical protein